MSKDVYLVVGLGNPGEKYRHTRHNVGFRTIDILGGKLNAGKAKARSEGLVNECGYNGKRVVLVKPQTFMNESGRCVSALMKRYKADASRMMVIVDDTDLPEGRLRVRGTGGAGTHNGMRSVVEYVGAQDFPRIRIGIGAKPEHWDLADWVLSDCQTDLSKTRMQDACARAADGILIWLEHGVEEAMRRCNRNADEKAAQE